MISATYSMYDWIQGGEGRAMIHMPTRGGEGNWSSHKFLLSIISAAQSLMTSRYEHSTAPIKVSEFKSAGQVYRFKSPIVFFPTWNETRDYLVIDNPLYSLYVYAKSRVKLYEELQTTFEMLWEVYAMEDENNLTPKAARLRQKLLEDIVIGEGDAVCH
jgi:hypothetical protein